MSIVLPGKSAIILGPSGTGKSHLALTALLHHGSGVVITAPGADEMESYAPVYSQASRPVWHEDGSFTMDADKPFILAPFDDEDFAPSLGSRELKATGQARIVMFLRQIRRLIEEDVNAGRAPRWAVLVEDTVSGIGELAYNAMLGSMGLVEPPKARGDGGSTFYGGYATRMGDVMRASRALKALGLHWIATSHVQIKDASDTYKQGELASKEQYLPLITGQFREKLTPIFDLALHSAVDRKGQHYCLWRPDMKRQAKSRYGKLAESGSIPNDWPTILSAIETAERPCASLQPVD